MDFWGSILGSCAWEEGEAESTLGPQVPPERQRAEALAPSTNYSKEATNSREVRGTMTRGHNSLLGPVCIEQPLI